MNAEVTAWFKVPKHEEVIVCDGKYFNTLVSSLSINPIEYRKVSGGVSVGFRDTDTSACCRLQSAHCSLLTAL